MIVACSRSAMTAIWPAPITTRHCATGRSGKRARAAKRAPLRAGALLCGRDGRGVEPHELDALTRAGERESAMLQIERVAAENLVPPAGERLHLGAIAGREQLQIFGIGDEARGDVVLLGAQFQ